MLKKKTKWQPCCDDKSLCDSRTDVSLDVTGDMAVWGPERVDILKCDPTEAQSSRSSAAVEEVLLGQSADTLFGSISQSTQHLVMIKKKKKKKAAYCRQNALANLATDKRQKT